MHTTLLQYSAKGLEGGFQRIISSLQGQDIL